MIRRALRKLFRRHLWIFGAIPQRCPLWEGRTIQLCIFSNVAVLHLTATDSDRKGFEGGFSDGTYGYLVPYYNGARFGEVCTIPIEHIQ